ncbi:hypothetical protein DFH94DRAFT_697739 [Russula ochroleuca]|uniref:Rhodopsin domain-containing protein n=1 Tax=Russula ochroleuca TaxID=152965 RepID=A0A9P5JY04_9AGAM|nr:hypothetical protein DFH94DRAFT_697739 [Russula ochroleuca]
MGINIHDPLVQIKVTESVCGFVAICTTSFRLWLRRSRPWYDDACAFLSLLCLFVQIAGVFMHVEHPSELSRLNRIASYYLISTTFYAVIWTARLSILMSIIRCTPDPVTCRRLWWLAGAFVATLCFFFAQLFWVCETMHNGWKNKPSPQCPLPKQVAICQLVSDVLADLSLILLPLRLIQGIKDKRLRRRLVFIFSTSIVTTIVSLVHASYIITRGGIPVIISALVEDCMSLTVANFPVVLSASIRHFSSSPSHDLDDDEPSLTWKFRTPTQPDSGTVTGQLSTGYRPRGGGGRGVGNTTTTTSEVTDTTIDLTKKSVIPAFEVGSEEQLFGASGVEKKTEGEIAMDGNDQTTAVATAVRREDRGVVRIDVLPYPREPLPSPLPPTPTTGEL